MSTNITMAPMITDGGTRWHLTDDGRSSKHETVSEQQEAGTKQSSPQQSLAERSSANYSGEVGGCKADERDDADAGYNNSRQYGCDKQYHRAQPARGQSEAAGMAFIKTDN